MTAATKRLSHVLAISTVVVLLGTGCFAASGAASEPAGVPASGGTTANTPTTTAITSDPVDATASRYGTRTKATFVVKAIGTKLHYAWQSRTATGAWKAIKGATSSKYTASARSWKNGTQFRVVVAGDVGSATSAPAKLTVLFPTRTAAKDAEAAFGLTGLTQGVDLSAYQYTPKAKVSVKNVAAWAGSDGFTLLRNGSGARPIKQPYISACSGKPRKTGAKPITEDCAYATLADSARASKLSLGHYWFNGWISSIDTTKPEVFAGGYTPTASAKQFVKWLKADGHYTRASKDPLVLDVEKGHAWTRTYKGKKYKLSLRAWNAEEVTAFLTTVKRVLTNDGYHANLYVYMSANAASRLEDDGAFVWRDVAGLARLWVASWGTDNGRIPAAQPKVGPWVNYGGWSIWQYTSNARFAGSGVGAMDADIAQADAWTPR